MSQTQIDLTYTDGATAEQVDKNHTLAHARLMVAAARLMDALRGAIYFTAFLGMLVLILVGTR